MVGTAEYQVARWLSSSGQNVNGSNFGGTTTVPPELSVAIVEAIRPWMWKSGITQKATSAGVSAYVRAMFSAEKCRLRCRSGTCLGGAVVRLGCSSRATLSGAG